MAIQKQKVQFFQDAVLDFFAKSGREELPWRTKGIGAYEVWVSEIMLQQTQVSRVLTYYTRFLQRFPTVLDLAAATWEDFLPYYEGLGYYNRGRNMLRTAVMVRDSFKGAFPKTREELLVLPGVGEYTAAAILSFAYNQDALAWDTNLKRVMGRFFFGDKKATLDESFFAVTLTAPKKELNAALMDFGSALCKAKPQCGNCPLRQKCQYYKTKGVSEATTEKTTWPR
jgi:A/G-specific adenine glycosylase